MIDVILRAGELAYADRSEVPFREAIELFLEDADPREIEEWMHDEQYVSSVEVAIG